jgi:Bacterial membrane protein YfhO
LNHKPETDNKQAQGEVTIPRESRSSATRKDVWILIFLAVFVLLKFRAFLLPGETLYWAGDPYEVAPQRALFYQNLRQGFLVLWDAFIGTGMPYLAEDFGVFYPLDLVTGILCPNFFNPYLLSWIHAFQFWLGGVFAFLYVRQLGLARVPSLVSSLCFISGGFLVGHAGQRNVVQTVTLLPLILYYLDKALLQRRALWASLAGLFLAFSFLAGHPNFFYFILLYIAGYFLFNLFLRFRARAWKDLVEDAWYFGVCGLFCLGISALQLGPLISTSLATYHGSRSYEWNSLLPFHILNLVDFLIPGYTMWTAETVDEGFAYIGLLPLLLALWAVIQSKDKRIVFLSLLALFSFIASLGDATPLYRILYDYLPGLNQFRIPARFILLTTFPLAVLAGFGVHRFLEGPGPGPQPMRLKSLYGLLWLALAGGFLSLVLMGFTLPGPAAGKEFWGWWKVLKKDFFWFLLFWSASYLLVWLRNRHYSLTWIKGGLILLVSVDLLLLGWVAEGYSRKDPTRSEVPQAQTIVSQLKRDPSLYRVGNTDRWLSSLLCYREGLNPYDLANLLGYVHTVVPKEYLEILFRVDKNPQLLDLLDVKYFIGAPPQPPPGGMTIQIGGKFGDREFDLPRPTFVSRLTIQSFLTHSSAMPQGRIVAWVELEKPDGSSLRIPLRAGLETAEWAIDRPGLNGAHQKARVVDSWDIPGEGYQGHAYEFTARLKPSIETAKITFHPVSGPEGLRIKKLLIDHQDLQTLLYSRFQAQGPWVYYNPTYFPRAFMIGKAKAFSQDSELLDQLENLNPRDTLLMPQLPPGYREPPEASFSTREATVLNYSPGYVKILTRADQNKFLVLSDTYSPFWRAEIDTHPAPVLKVNYGLRGLYVPQGEHRVEFFFRFYPFYFGLAVTFITLAILLAWAGFFLRSEIRNRTQR